MNRFAPSEEVVLHCDVPGCQAQLSIVFDVSRSEHDWGRVSVYEDWNHNIEALATRDKVIGMKLATAVRDYDLCAEHYRGLRAFLEGTLRERPSGWRMVGVQ